MKHIVYSNGTGLQTGIPRFVFFAQALSKNLLMLFFMIKTLIDMVRRRPLSMDSMAQIPGAGTSKLERYGAEFLSIIQNES